MRFEKNIYETHTDYFLRINKVSFIFSVFNYERKIPLHKAFFDTGDIFSTRIKGISYGKFSIIIIY